MSHRLNLLESIRAPRAVVRFLQREPWELGLLAFVGYYVVPLIATAVTGALASPRVVEQQFTPVGLSSLGGWLSRSPTMKALAGVSHAPVYYGDDVVHFAMSLTTPLVGAVLIMTALQRFGPVFDYLVASGQLEISRQAIDAEVLLARRRCRSIPAYCMFVAAGMLLAAFMISRTRSPLYAWWWGHVSHGPAGVLLAIAIGIVVACGAAAIYLLSVGLQAVSALLRHPVTLRPFHPDGCNGFGQFGDFLILLFFLSVTIAAAMCITFFGGYLDVASFMGTWVVAAGILVSIPLILIGPLVRCTLQIGRAKQRRLSRMEGVLNQALLDLESGLSETADTSRLHDQLDKLLQARTLAASLYGSYNFPFKPRIVGALSVTYVLQLTVLAREAFSRFSSGR